MMTGEQVPALDCYYINHPTPKMQKTLAIHIQYFRISSARITRNVVGRGPKENKWQKLILPPSCIIVCPI